MTTIRVFPRKTSMTPDDVLAFIGNPPLFRPDADEVHVSVAFTWDIREGLRLQRAWSNYYSIVKLGGPAIPSGGDGFGKFVPGKYLEKGITITSRGCNRKCPWCFVPEREGDIKLLPIEPGWIIQDNNLLACPRSHQEKVFSMLRKQRKAAKFAGGIDARLVDDWIADQFKDLRISEIFLAADTEYSLRPLAKAVEKLSFLGRKKLRCFVMIAHDGETIPEAQERLEEVWNIGCLPFAQLYQPPDKRINYSKEWKKLNRDWSRPAITRTIMSNK